MRVKITNWKKISVSMFIVGAVFALLSSQTRAANQSDAIAVRIMPNINHDSIETWYANQGYKGSPQSLIVDGYEAIRDGRTVFVNAANLDTVGNKIYTNIYLISYNQESEVKTVDILGQLVSHWKFNNNISEVGHCSISTINCQADTDCPTNYICSNTAYSSDHAVFDKGKCVLKNIKTCNIDSDCPVSLFCDSLKARSIRDIKRLSDFNKLKGAIELYKVTNGNYPGLQSGTYVPGVSLSVWPSWKETLLNGLGLGESITDPVNNLGYCGGYDAKTCWDNKNNTFVNTNLTLPNGSNVFVYKSTQNGINYSLCSVFEASGYDTIDKKISTNACAVSAYSGSNTNTAPVIISSSLIGEVDKAFNGFIKVKDNEGDSISWKLSPNYTVDSSHSNAWSTWSAAPVLQDTGILNQRKVYAAKVGNAGSYQMTLILTDSRGASTSTVLTINASQAGKPVIEADDMTYFVDPVNPLKYTFSVEGSNSKPVISVTPLDSKFSAINSLINAAINNAVVTSVGLNKNKIDFSLVIPTSIQIPNDIVVPIRIKATASGQSSTKDINLNLKIEKPYLNFQCENMARIGKPYQINSNSCLLGKATSGNHVLSYKVLSGPSGLVINTDTSNNVYLLASAISTTTTTGLKEVKISVTNQYGATTEKTFNLTVNSFCGDGIKQSPNTETRGGYNNDGIESCDGADGIQTNMISTSSSVQYGCTTETGVESPYPIIDTKACTFKDADQGGGYCGDGVCQFKINAGGTSKNIENCWNCRQDCGTCVATLKSSADAEQMAYYNKTFLYKTTNVNEVGSSTLKLLPGKNVFAFWAQDYASSGFGLAFKLVTGAGSTVFQEFNTLGNLPVDSKLVCTPTDRASGLGSPSLPDYNPIDVQSDWANLSFDDSAWRQTTVVTTKDLFDGVPYVVPTGTRPNRGAILCRLSFDYKPYSMATCVPDCTNKTCGSDGCGGTCGTCGTDSFCDNYNYQCQSKCGYRTCGVNSYDGASCGSCAAGVVCLDGLCPSADTNIQICSDNAHDTFFNGSNYATDGRRMSTLGGTGNLWQNVEGYKVKLADQNVFAIHAQDWGGIHGVSATLNVKVDSKDVLSMNTNDYARWYCNRTATNGWTTQAGDSWSINNGWTKSMSMNNPTRTSGNALASSTNSAAGIKQIWFLDTRYGTTYNQYDTAITTPTVDDIYCRYTFNASDITIPCVPNCEGRCGGFDGCGGHCSTTCPAGQVCGGDPAVLNRCSVKK